MKVLDATIACQGNTPNINATDFTGKPVAPDLLPGAESICRDGNFTQQAINLLQHPTLTISKVKID
jgi:hypothetical protein